jgi:uncharacterized protein YcnI
MKVSLAVVSALAAALVYASVASAHAELSPPVVLSNQSQLFTLAVPTEKENATTSQVEFTPPSGFSIDSFVPAAGWKRTVQQSGSGENTSITKVTWTGGAVPTEEDAVFQFLAVAESSKTYTFSVRQTYSDGSVVDWTGPESSDTPAPTIEAKNSFGGSGTSIVTWIALALGAIGVVLGIVALLSGSGKRSLA